MDEPLKNLIALCEEEKIKLSKFIDECLAEGEYLMAHHHSGALHQLNRTLQTLHTFCDPLYNTKQFQLTNLRMWEKRIAEAENDVWKELYAKQIKLTEEIIAQLSNTQTQKEQPEAISFFDDTLINLFSNKIKNVRLTLNKTEKLHLAFVYTKNSLKVTLPYLKQHIRRFILYDENIMILQKFGFEIAASDTKLILILTGSKHEILESLKLILSKIVFEIFYVKEFENESYIEFTEK